MNIRPRLLLLVTLIFSLVSTKSIVAQDAKSELDEAFIAAVKSYSLEEMQKHIEAGADVNASVSYISTSGDCDWVIECSPLIFVIRANQLGMVKILLKVKNKLHTTLNQALVEAIEQGHSAIAEELINEGADVNWIDNENNDSLLMSAIRHARPLSEFSSQAQARKESRWEERKKIIGILLKAGAHVKHVNKYGKTALMEAITKYDLNTVQDLLNLSAMTQGSFFGFGKKPINNVDQDGNTALIIAIKNVSTTYVSGRNDEYNRCLNSQKIVEVLLKTPGIDLDHVNKKGETAITLLEKLNNQKW